MSIPSFPAEDKRALAAELDHGLRQAGAEKMRADRVHVVAETVALILLTLLIPILLDYRFFLPKAGRILIEIPWLALVVLGIIRIVLEWRHTLTSNAVALDLEQHLSNARCEVSTASQYGEVPELTHEHETTLAAREVELVSALRHRATFRVQHSGSPYRLPFIIGGTILAVVITLVAMTLTVSPVSRLALQRIIIPIKDTQYTEVDVHPGDSLAAIGDSLEIKAEFRGRMPDQPLIEWQDASGAWQPYPLVQISPDTFTYQVENVSQHSTYRVRGNDALSPEYHLHAYAVPKVARWQIDIVAPAYAQLPDRQSITGNAIALRGSELRWHIVSTLPLQKAELDFRDLADNVTLTADNPTAWNGKMSLEKDQNYRAVLFDTDGHPGHSTETFQLVAVPDAPPTVDISGIPENISAGAQDKITFNVQADDDIGLADLKVIYQHPGSPDTVVSLFPGGNPGRHITTQATLDLAPFNLQPYDTLIFYAQAIDNNTYDGPGVGRSHVFFVTIRHPGEQGPPHGSGSGAGNVEKIDLTKMQRDLISGTTRLVAQTRAAMTDLATAQNQIMEYSAQFDHGLPANTPPEAHAAMKDAIAAMGNATFSLGFGDRPKAIGQEEIALVDLYKAAQLLKNMPTQPLNSDASGKMLSLSLMEEDNSSNQPSKSQQALQQALAEAQALKQAQEDLQKGQSGQSKDKDAAGKQGQGEKPSDAGSAGKEGELAQQARKLADDLAAAAGAGSKSGRSMSETATDAANQMEAADGGFSHGDDAEVEKSVGNSVNDLGRIIAALKKILGESDRQSDVSAEEAPPEFKEQLNRYYEKLSHEK
jgi:hypothetical protein